MLRREHLKKCKHNVGRTQQGFGCGGFIEKAFKCDIYELCVLEKVCKKPENVGVCEGCPHWEEK